MPAPGAHAPDGGRGAPVDARARGASVDARARILDAAYELFSRDGIRGVPTDAVIQRAGVAKATLYHHFPSKQALVLAFLDLRQQRWTYEWLRPETERRATAPRDRLLTVFDVLDEWFNRPDYEGCAFITTLLDAGETDEPVRRATVRHLAAVRDVVRVWAEDAELADPTGVACQLQILMMGAIVSASRGDARAARRARGLAELLVGGSVIPAGA